jgi:hypothetical protein
MDAAGATAGACTLAALAEAAVMARVGGGDGWVASWQGAGTLAAAQAAEAAAAAAAGKATTAAAPLPIGMLIRTRASKLA